MAWDNLPAGKQAPAEDPGRLPSSFTDLSRIEVADLRPSCTDLVPLDLAVSVTPASQVLGFPRNLQYNGLLVQDLLHQQKRF